ncbi:hypothetical protein SDC9_185127 [bioreactor metagenome]|uniref:Lipoyl-binding domain-containing protein n=1 Tax=bioreactor metagenome TaxID=1076179 RepID=A0A645HEZ2_9ZZZZ
MPTTIQSPLSGRVVNLCAEPQSAVASGDALLIVESMKMEIPVEAESAGTVVRFLVAEGDEVSEGQALVELQ